MIKRIIKKSIKWLRDLLDTVISLIKIMIFSGFRSNYKQVQANAQRCYILGNGPSLKEAILNNDFTNHEDKDVFVVNEFVLSDQFLTIKPAYYLFVDPGYWTDRTFEEMIRLRKQVFNELNQKTSWKLTILISKEGYDVGLLQREIHNPLITIKFFNTTEVKGFTNFVYFNYSHNFGMPVLQNVLVAAIYLAINMNYKEINLFGADHSWLPSIHVNNLNDVCQKNDHFYDEEEVSGNVWLKFSGEPYKLHEILVDLSKMFAAYHLLQGYAEYKQCKIYNRTKGSFIDAFERKLVNEK